MSVRHAPAPARVREGTVLALDNVPLDLPVAGAGSRVLAAFIDYMLLGALAFAWVVAFFAISVAWPAVRGVWAIIIVIVGLFLLDWGYFAGLEVALGGRTPGKKVVGLRVVGREGGSPSTGALILRNLLRSPDLLVGVPLIALDPLGRRLGDRVAGTLVVHDHARGGELLLARIPAGWGAREVALAESLLLRSHDMEPERAGALAGRMLALIQARDPGFLDGVERSRDPMVTLRRAFGLADER